MKNAVKKYRVLSDLTQSQLADKVGVSRQTINAIEKGQYNLSTVLALKISSVLKEEFTSLFELTNDDWE